MYLFINLETLTYLVAILKIVGNDAIFPEGYVSNNLPPILPIANIGYIHKVQLILEVM
jgi:hypothetical protein